MFIVGVLFYHMDYMAALSKANFGAHGYAASFVLSGDAIRKHYSPINSLFLPLYRVRVELGLGIVGQRRGFMVWVLINSRRN